MLWPVRPMQKQEKEPEVSTNRVQVVEGSRVEGRQFLVEAVVTSADSLWAMPKNGGMCWERYRFPHAPLIKTKKCAGNYINLDLLLVTKGSAELHNQL